MLLPGPTTANKENETTHNPKAKLYWMYLYVLSKRKKKQKEKHNYKQNAQKLKEKLKKKIAFSV